MIVATVRDIRAFSPSVLPPPRHDGRLRILNIGLPILGLSSFTKSLAEHAATRDDVVMTHFELVNATWMKVLFRVSPVPWSMDLQCANMVNLWRCRIRRAIDSGALNLDCFDAVVTCPQHHTMAFIDRRPDRPFVISAHTDATAANTVRDFGDSPITTRPLDRCDRYLLPRCDLVTCMGWFAGNSARDDYGVDPDRLMLVPPTTTEITPGDPPGKTPARGRLARIAIAGNDWVRKGGPELLRWHQSRWTERAELHVIGQGAPEDPAARNVVWHGRVPREKLLNELFPSMDLFVLPTKRDMSPWVLVEAAGAGIAAVSSRLGGIPDEVIDGQTGLLCTPGAENEFIRAIESLLDDPDRCFRMGLAAREYARRHFTPRVVYGGLLDRLWTEFRRQAPRGIRAEAE
ncbi:MAG: glycosyltransferase [Phycisphaeraceae bacterium]|nr:glycosyltransferase [Phycisphaeraceae bacterium]